MIFRGKEASYDFPGVETLPVLLSFPEPVMVAHYIAYRHAAAVAEADDEAGAAQLMRIYRGALAVAETTLDEGVDDTAVSDDNGETAVLTLDATDPGDDQLPLNYARWVADCAEQVIGPLINVESVAQITVRRANSRHTSPTFTTTDDDIPRLLPGLAEYSGRVTFHEPLTASIYRSWVKASRILPGYERGAFENSHFMRNLRAAVPLVKEWDVPGVAWKDVSRHNWQRVPLAAASFLLETADVYLSKRMAIKKSHGKLAQLR